MSSSIIRVTDLKRSYRSGRRSVEILHGVSFDIAAGTFAAIIGPSGGGKSTLLKSLAGLAKPTSGSVEIEHMNIYTMNDHNLSKYRNATIGIVFQDYRLVPYQSALDNVRVPMVIAGIPKKEQIHRATAILKAVGLESHVHSRIDELSGGQQQRVGIARAIIMKPQILIADEPTGNLDETTGHDIIRLLKAIQRNMGMTIIMVTHNTQLARSADTVLTLRDGKIQRS